MALIQSSPLYPTRAERLALSIASAISSVVAERMQTRAERLDRTEARLGAEAAAQFERQRHRERAHLLGLR